MVVAFNTRAQCPSGSGWKIVRCRTARIQYGLNLAPPSLVRIGYVSDSRDPGKVVPHCGSFSNKRRSSVRVHNCSAHQNFKYLNRRFPLQLLLQAAIRARRVTIPKFGGSAHRQARSPGFCKYIQCNAFEWGVARCRELRDAFCLTVVVAQPAVIDS